MNNKAIRITTLILAILLSCTFLSASANSLAPDRSQQVLDLLALECQNINDYYDMARNGDTSRFDSVKEHIAIMINNVSLLMNGYDNGSVNKLWNMYNQFSPDASSAQRVAETCSTIRGEIHKKISKDPAMNPKNGMPSSFEECAAAGYHVNGNTCFIGGSSVFDSRGNLIGYYYSDCYDSQGFHMGSCWDCYYGADNEGCIERP